MAKQTRAQRTREALIAAAAVEFDRHGYAGTSLSRVHQACGVTMGALTFHFPAKTDLAAAVYREAETVTQEALARLEPAITVRSVVDFTLELARLLDHEVIVRAAARLTQERTPSVGWHAVWRSALRDLMTSVHEARSPEPGQNELELLAVYLTAGAEAALRAGRSGADVRAQLERLWNLALNAVSDTGEASAGAPHRRPHTPLLPTITSSHEKGPSMTRRCALVTGGSRGIGAAIAAELAVAGHRVAVHCRSDSTAAKAVLDGLHGTGHALVTGDVGELDAARRIIDSAVEQLGTVDVLVNNAGVYAEQPVSTTSFADWQADWRRLVDVNLLGPADLIWCLVNHLRHRLQGPQGARIINVGSRGVYRGEPDAPAYGATKAALHALTQSLAQSLGPHGITVTAVAPGFVRTDLTEPMLAGTAGEAVRSQSPLGRIAVPSDVAAAVAWLSTAQAEWCSGAVLDVNGASHLR